MHQLGQDRPDPEVSLHVIRDELRLKVYSGRVSSCTRGTKVLGRTQTEILGILRFAIRTNVILLFVCFRHISFNIPHFLF